MTRIGQGSIWGVTIQQPHVTGIAGPRDAPYFSPPMTFHNNALWDARLLNRARLPKLHLKIDARIAENRTSELLVLKIDTHRRKLHFRGCKFSNFFRMLPDPPR